MSILLLEFNTCSIDPTYNFSSDLSIDYEERTSGLKGWRSVLLNSVEQPIQCEKRSYYQSANSFDSFLLNSFEKKVESNRIKSPQVGSFIRYLFPWMPIILSEKKTREQKSRVHSVASWTEVDVPFNRSISLVLLAFSSLNLQVSNVQIKRITLTSMKRPRKEHIEWVFEPFYP